MDVITLARRAAELGQKEAAQKAYTAALEQGGLAAQEELEAAAYLFFSKADPQLPYTALVSLYNRDWFQEECLSILTQGFYEPNKKLLQIRYEKNCKLLAKYPYLFRKDFLSFEELPIRFYPYDDNGYVPFDKKEAIFGPYVNFNTPIVSRNFFRNLDQPVLADDVYSQYELEYLHDNVRKSEWVGRENHVYLHYTDWGTFCAYLQCLNLRPLLEEKKLVFLIEDEIAQYPIDFKDRFGIDYSQYPVKPVGIREVNRLIWHTQLSTHNGGDFFNEIMFDHPNVLSYTSIIYDDLLEEIQSLCEQLNHENKVVIEENFSLSVAQELHCLGHVTEKDMLVAMFLGKGNLNRKRDHAARIVPALLIQPHFYNIFFELNLNQEETDAILSSPQYEKIQKSPLFRDFKYLKTFTPIRRITTSYAASVRYMQANRDDGKAYPDILMQRILNRSFMVGPQDSLFADSVLVRFEDGKLNPKATFTALAAFLDIPYTESMTYCSGEDGKNPVSMEGNVVGFDAATVYRTYDTYADPAERALLEVLMHDVYTQYGYNFHYYKGDEVDKAWIEDTLAHCTCLQQMIKDAFPEAYHTTIKKMSDEAGVEIKGDTEEAALQEHLDNLEENRRHVIKYLLKGLHFVNRNGQPLHFMKLLELDPALLEQPLYH